MVGWHEFASFWRYAPAVLATVVAGWVGTESVIVTEADWRSSQVCSQADQWADGEAPWTDPEWRQAVEEVKQAIAWTPRDATLHECLALLYTVKGLAQWGEGQSDSPGVLLYGVAMKSQTEAVRLRPLQGISWANLALMRYVSNNTVAETFDAWHKALTLGPNEPEVQETLKTVAELAWPRVPDDVSKWLETQEPGILNRLKIEEDESRKAQ